MSQTANPAARRAWSFALPLVAAALLVLVPLQAAGLFQRLQAMAQPAPSAPVPPPPAPAVAAPARSVPTTLAQSTLPMPGGLPAVSQRPPDGKLLEELNRRSAELDRRE